MHRDAQLKCAIPYTSMVGRATLLKCDEAGVVLPWKHWWHRTATEKTGLVPSAYRLSSCIPLALPLPAVGCLKVLQMHERRRRSVQSEDCACHQERLDMGNRDVIVTAKIVACRSLSISRAHQSCIVGEEGIVEWCPESTAYHVRFVQ